MPSPSQESEDSATAEPSSGASRRPVPGVVPWAYDGLHPTEAVFTPRQARGMRMFWWDGFFAWGSEAILVQYLALYAVAFGATAAQIGVLSSMVALAGASAFLPGARLAERWGRRKLIVVLSAGLGARPALLALAVLPFFFEGRQVIFIIAGLAALRYFMGGVGIPAWTSLTADLVPSAIRGRFLASRSVGMGVAALMAVPLAGGIINWAGFPHGWEMAWLLAFLLGQASTLAYARIPEPRPAPAAAVKSEGPGRLLDDTNFLFFCGTALIWNLTLYAASPFFNVYLVENLGGSALWVGGLVAVAGILELAGLSYFGPIIDRRGAKLVMVIGGLTIPFLPWAWILVQAPWQIIPINVAGGFLWAAYNLGSLNLLLAISPDQKRPTYAAAYQSAVYLSAFAGPLMGGFLAQAFGYRLLFGVSGAGRLLSTLLFVRFVQEIRPRPSLQPAPAEQP